MLTNKEIKTLLSDQDLDCEGDAVAIFLAGAAWQREEDARIAEEHGVRVYGAHDIAAAIRRAVEQT